MEDCTAHSLICDVAVLAEGSVLMLRYANPAKFEHPTRAAVRILKEQLALEVEDEPRLGLIESFQGNDESWHLSFHHVVELPGSPHLRPAKGIAAAQWFPLDELPPRSEVAHNGWSLRVLKKMVGAPTS